MAESETRVSRDTRLLILVIVVAVVVLFVLAQFRFPGAEVSLSTVTPSGLDRLAAQSNYDALAAAVQTAVKGVEPSVIVFDLEGVPDGSKQPEQRRAQAIRLRDGLAVGLLPASFKVTGPAGGANAPLIRGTDPSRSVFLAVLTAENSPARSANAVADFAGYTYVAVVEPAKGGPTVAPVFIGAQGRLQLDGWAEAYWQWSTNQPSNGVTAARAFDDRASTFTLSNSFRSLLSSELTFTPSSSRMRTVMER